MHRIKRVQSFARAAVANSKTVESESESTAADLLKTVKSSGKRLYDKVYYGDLFAPTGSFQLSYARLLELLHRRKVKRLILLSDGKSAIVMDVMGETASLHPFVAMTDWLRRQGAGGRGQFDQPQHRRRVHRMRHQTARLLRWIRQDPRHRDR